MMAGSDYRECNCGWADISTAPRDGTQVMLARYEGTELRALWDDHWSTGGAECWCDASPGLPPTHWMPLPEPPEEKR